MALDTKSIRRWISQSGMSERMFAEKNGFSYPIFTMWLGGKHYPNFANRMKLAKALHCRIDELEIEEAPVMMFGDADTAVKAFCAAVDRQMDPEVTRITCLAKDCPYNSKGVMDRHYCNAKAIIIRDGRCMTKDGDFPVQG